MKTASVTAFKSRLSEYLSMAEAGQVVLITDHGRPVAQVEAPSAACREMERSHLYRRGLMRRPVEALDFAEFDGLPLPAGTQTLTAAVLEDREER